MASLHLKYAEEDRNFAREIRENEPDLYKAIVMADLCLLCRDERVTANQLRSFLRVKRCLEGSAVRTLLDLQTLGDFLQYLGGMARRVTTGCYAGATATNLIGLGPPIIMPHVMPTDIQSQIPQTDNYFVEYWKHREETGRKEAEKQRAADCGEGEQESMKRDRDGKRRGGPASSGDRTEDMRPTASTGKAHPPKLRSIVKVEEGEETDEDAREEGKNWAYERIGRRRVAGKTPSCNPPLSISSPHYVSQETL